jgi:predicted ATPase/DNA-binding SARP family transcriptional activator/Tfp pilus assembly protein PilF
MTVQLSLLGLPTVEYGGKLVGLPFERRTQLLAFLALKREWVGRAEVAAMLWPEQESKLAYTNLRKTLHRLHSLPWARAFESRGSALRFEADTDVFAFDSALREQRIADALALWRGELLVGFDDDHSDVWSSWLTFERGRLRLAWRDAAISRLALELDPAEGIALSMRLLEVDPLDEAALRAHMTWLARGGQSGRARQAYREFVQRLADDLGLAPGIELRAWHDSLGASGALPPPVAPGVPETHDDGFVGRAVELRRVGELMAREDCRLICVTGPGGVGKTRLAQQAMHEVAARFADGAVFVSLEDIAATSELGGRLAQVLGVRLAGRDDPLDQTIEFLRERQVLLVLDNFEHLTAEAAILQHLLKSCLRLKIIVTSRVRLAIAMEWSLPLAGLPCPEPEDQDRFEAFDAARLFIRAATRVESALVPSVEAASIIEICQQVEGLPLALELAAACTRVLSCDAIAAELRKGTELLHTVDAAHPTRHASIEAVFEQSWKLLGAAERDALSRLSVFHAGFSAESARAVAAAPLPVLAALVDKSLLRKDASRIFMHALVQQLAALRLGDGQARASADRAHASYFHHRMAQSRHAIEDGEREALHWMDTEFENCRHAWRWSAAHGVHGDLAKSALTLLYFCEHRGRFEDGLLLLRKTLESSLVSDDKPVEALLLSVASHFEFRLDRYADAEATASRALAASRGKESYDARLQCLKVLGSCCVRLGRHADAKRFFQQAVQMAPESTNPHNAAAMYANLAVIEKSSGNYDEALRLTLQSLLLHRRHGDAAGEAGSLSTLGGLYVAKQDLESAAAYFREGLAICDRHGLASTRGVILANLTEVAVKMNDLDLAERYALRALEIAQAAGNRGLMCWLKLQLVRLALRRSDLTAARSELAVSMAIALDVAQPVLQLAGTICFAQILNAQGESECAHGVMRFAADHPSIDVPTRNEAQTHLKQWHSAASTPSAWPGLALEDLAHRIVIESNVAHAPLIATLRGELVH